MNSWMGSSQGFSGAGPQVGEERQLRMRLGRSSMGGPSTSPLTPGGWGGEDGSRGTALP